MNAIPRHRIILRAMRPVVRTRNQPEPHSVWRAAGRVVLAIAAIALLVAIGLAARVALFMPG
jgi:hypothetical protein